MGGDGQQQTRIFRHGYATPVMQAKGRGSASP